MATTSRTKNRMKKIGPGRILLGLVEVPAGAAAMWLAWSLAMSNPLEETFENSMVNFVPGALIPFLLYMAIAGLGIWLIYDAVSTWFTAIRQSVQRHPRKHARR